MAIPYFDTDIGYIQKLGDNPNADDGLIAQELKEAFDKAPLEIQKFINDYIVPGINNYNTVHNHGGTTIHPANIELTPGAYTSHGGYIDFHFNGDYSTENRDYTSRIIESPAGVLKVNGYDIVTKANACDWYNLSLNFENGVARFENSGIRYMDVIMVQRRGAMANANLSFCTGTYDGYAIICTDSDVNGTIAVNIHLTRL